MRTVRLTVNGRSVVEAIDERTHLADFLRDKLTLTATHLRCEQGVCGACTLLIDGQPARSCITYAALCEGAEVTTLEGLEHDSVVTALRRAFMAEHALQCGFCTPAMLVTARDIVTRVAFADDSRIRLELSGNLCRCTGYAGIVRAIRRVLDERNAGTLSATRPSRERLGQVGARPQHSLRRASSPFRQGLHPQARLRPLTPSALPQQYPTSRSDNPSPSRSRPRRSGAFFPTSPALCRACRARHWPGRSRTTVSSAA
jgi:aerobic carbon-monoxide dehydrogenase small subunit